MERPVPKRYQKNCLHGRKNNIKQFNTKDHGETCAEKDTQKEIDNFNKKSSTQNVENEIIDVKESTEKQQQMERKIEVNETIVKDNANEKDSKGKK